MLDLSLLPSADSYYNSAFTLKGRKHKHLVPCCFHQDKSPSLSLDLRTGRFNCFGCGASGGDILDFHKLKNGLSTTEAAKDLGAWVDTHSEPEEAIAARKERIAEADRHRQAQKQQAEQQELAEANAYLPAIQTIIKNAAKYATPTPYTIAKEINSSHLLSIPSEALQRLKDPANSKHTLGYGLQGLLTIATLETLDGQLVALQVFDGVPNDKGKFARRYLGRPVCLAGYYRVGDWSTSSVKVICESVNDAITLFEATGYPTLAAGSSSQLLAAAVAVQKRHPLDKIVICGDNDPNGNGQHLASKAAIAVNGVVVIPTDYKDANDLYQAQGKQAVKTMIDDSLNSTHAPLNHEATTDHANAPLDSNSVELHGIKDSADTWPPPEPIAGQNEQSDYPLEYLPAPLQALTQEIIDYLQCPVPLVVNAILATLSLSAQGLVDVARDKETVSPVSLYLMVIAESGERKSTADKAVTQHLSELDKQRFLDDAELQKAYKTELDIWTAERDGLLQALRYATKNGEPTVNTKEELKQLDQQEPERPRGKTMLYEDTTPEGLIKAMLDGCPSAGIFSNEAGLVFGSHGMNSESLKRNLAALNKFWEGGEVRSTRADTKNNKLLSGRRLTLCLATQESTVKDFFENSRGLARGTGFGARFLIAWPTSTQGNRPYKEPPQQWPHKERFIKRTTELLTIPLTIHEETGALQPHTLHFSAKAKAAWTDFYNATEYELRTGGELEEIKDVTSKAADNVARIAALFHVFEHGITGNISEAHIVNAGHVMTWHLMESRRFFGEIALSKELNHVVLFDNWLKKYCFANDVTRISTMQARQLCPNALRDKAVFDAVMGQLADLHRLKATSEGKKKWIEINPRLLEAENELESLEN
ncbi:MAG: DUF3987 domain-containing protein [Agitococcus sp.]|nr:DUF3987 domain-containing protein [Agitococcus sp.]